MEKFSRKRVVNENKITPKDIVTKIIAICMS